MSAIADKTGDILSKMFPDRLGKRVVKEVSGHKNERSFRRYVKLAESYKTQLINKAYSKENIDKVLNGN